MGFGVIALAWVIISLLAWAFVRGATVPPRGDESIRVDC
jgi:hypothetical protein